MASHLCELCSAALGVSKVYSHKGVSFYVCDMCSGESKSGELEDLTEAEIEELLTEAEIVTLED